MVSVRTQVLKHFGSARSKHLAAARRRRPVGPSAIQERNFVGLLYTKKIIFSLASRPGGAANPMKMLTWGTPYKFKSSSKCEFQQESCLNRVDLLRK